MATEPLSCRRCGATGVYWRQARSGRWYLAVILPPTYDHPHSLPIPRPHVCPSPEQIERRARQDAEISAQIEREIQAQIIRRAHEAGEHLQPEAGCLRCELDELAAFRAAQEAR